MDYQMDKCVKCGETRKEHSYDGACYGKCGEYVHSEVLIGKIFHARNTHINYKCVGMTPSGKPILQGLKSGDEEYIPIGAWTKNYEEVHVPVVTHMYASISHGYSVHTNVVHWGVKEHFDDNVKFIFTDGELTGVEIV